MDENSTFDFLKGLQRTGIRPGLGRMRELMERLGHPERAFASVLITGTNGKGSTAAFLEAILASQGYKTGLFTSPHLVDVRERVRIAGRKISQSRFRELGMEVRTAMSGGGKARPVRATYFEALTAIGFLAFATERVDIAVVEVGMGGRLDSTNVIDPLVSVLTNVTLDHTRYLGETVEAIAKEKMGVARRGRPLVTAVTDSLFNSVVGPRIRDLHAMALRLDRDFFYTRRDGRIDFVGREAHVQDIAVSLRGTFQSINAAIALATAEALTRSGLKISVDAMKRGIGSAVWPGRFDKVSDQPVVILDGCHNVGAAACLAETLDCYPLPRPLIMVHGSKPDKDFKGVLSHLAPRCDAVIETSIPGLMEPSVLANACKEVTLQVHVEAIPEFISAYERAVELAKESGTVLITGSLYLVGAALAAQPWRR